MWVLLECGVSERPKMKLMRETMKQKLEDKILFDTTGIENVFEQNWGIKCHTLLVNVAIKFINLLIFIPFHRNPVFLL